jgi:hypothetical protein
VFLIYNKLSSEERRDRAAISPAHLLSLQSKRNSEGVSGEERKGTQRGAMSSNVAFKQILMAGLRILVYIFI